MASADDPRAKTPALDYAAHKRAALVHELRQHIDGASRLVKKTRLSLEIVRGDIARSTALISDARRLLAAIGVDRVRQLQPPLPDDAPAVAGAADPKQDE